MASAQVVRMSNLHLSSPCDVLIVQWLECHTGRQNVASSISVWGPEIVFLRINLTNVHLSSKVSIISIDAQPFLSKGNHWRQ